MPYVTLKLSPAYHQCTLEDILDGNLDPRQFAPVSNSMSGTRTVYRNTLSREFVNRFNIPGMVRVLKNFTEQYAPLYEKERTSLYKHMEIPKDKYDPKTGKMETRPIDEPCPELKCAQYALRSILQNDCGALYHTNAFAYIENRCCVDALKRHQGNVSKWFLKTDFSNFFGSTTPDFVNRMFSMIFPFSEICKDPEGKQALEKALDLCFLNNGLPQGTPISPMLTNIMMIPIDYELTKGLRDVNGKHFIYTRYADDMLISCKLDFQFTAVTKFIEDTLNEFGAPFALKPQKTRYGSANGHNFNLGLILNDKNEITIGYKKKWAFKGQLYDYIQRHKREERITLSEVQQLAGVLSYYRSVEPDFWKNVIKRLNEKCETDLDKLIADDLKNLTCEVA